MILPETHQIPIPAVATAQQGSTSNVPMATAVQSTNSTMFTRPPLTSNGPQGDVSNRV